MGESVAKMLGRMAADKEAARERIAPTFDCPTCGETHVTSEGVWRCGVREAERRARGCDIVKRQPHER